MATAADPRHPRTSRRRGSGPRHADDAARHCADGTSFANGPYEFPYADGELADATPGGNRTTDQKICPNETRSGFTDAIPGSIVGTAGPEVIPGTAGPEGRIAHHLRGACVGVDQAVAGAVVMWPAKVVRMRRAAQAAP